MAVPPPPPLSSFPFPPTSFDVLKFLPESQASGVDFRHFQFISNHVMSLRHILSPHFHESSEDQSSYKNTDIWGKKSFFTCRSDVILQTIFFKRTHTKETRQDQSKVYLFSNIYSKDVGHCDVSMQTFRLRCKSNFKQCNVCKQFFYKIFL